MSGSGLCPASYVVQGLTLSREGRGNIGGFLPPGKRWRDGWFRNAEALKFSFVLFYE